MATALSINAYTSRSMNHSDPAALFQSAVSSLKHEDWIEVARHCDEVSLRAFRRQIVDHLVSANAENTFTAELLMKHSPDMPREAAEYQVAQHRKFANPDGRLRREFPTASSVEELMLLEPAQFFAAWLDGRSPRRQVAAIVESRRVPAHAVAELVISMGQHMLEYAVLGVVSDGADVAHVVYRQRVDENELWTGEAADELAKVSPEEQVLMREQWAHGMLRFARCRRQKDGSWRLHTDHDFLSMGSIGAVGFHANEVSVESSADSTGDSSERV